MKIKHYIAGIVILLFLLFSGWLKNRIHRSEALSFSEGDKIESFELPSIEGGKVSLTETIGKNRMIWVNFWATWCGPCRREMPIMADIYDEFNKSGFTVLAISVSEQPVDVKEYLAENPVPFPVLLDTAGTLSKGFNIESLPTSFLVDSTGVIMEVGVGIQEDWKYIIERKLGKDE